MFSNLDPYQYVKFRAEQMALIEQPDKFFIHYQARGVAFRSKAYEIANDAYQVFIAPFMARAETELRKAVAIANATLEANLVGDAPDGKHDSLDGFTDEEKAQLLAAEAEFDKK